MPGAAPRSGLDLSFAPTLRGGGGEPGMQVSAPGAGANWMAAFDAWWARHGHYPHEAAAEGQEGTVRLHMLVNPDGTVRGLQLTSRSGSIWLDQGALATFRGAPLPPLTAPAKDGPLDLNLTINYHLLR